ncbi:MAG: FlgD immunoglobulin-like domain containing protein [bacterium]|nr:FlgD immunoglobulin-like domain containing protein [bacterium]
MVAVVLICLSNSVSGGLASKYLCDRGIEKDKAVVFTEDFEELTLDDVAVRWNDNRNLDGMSLVSDVPPVSAGTKSLRITSIIGQNEGGLLYKRLDTQGVGYDTLYARFYVKFAPSCHPIHHFVQMGGYNPPTNWPQGGAGIRPDGDDSFVSGIEPFGAAWRWDFYTYWMHMRTNPGGKYWGNDFINDDSLKVEKDKWICIEIMMKMNNPLTSYNGEQEVWINGNSWYKDGQKISHLGLGFPNGNWIWDSFSPDTTGLPFEGFQWRFVDALDINWFKLEFYMTDGLNGQMDSVLFDDLVIATEYIGPMPGVEEDLSHNVSAILQNYPNPFSSQTVIRYQITGIKSDVSLKIYSLSGQLVRTLVNGELSAGYYSVTWNGKDDNSKCLLSGIYFGKLKVGGKFSQPQKLLLLNSK